ncbi:MAG: TonB-dependent receptor, partial [Pseudonocardiaceae bacterium]
LTLGPSNRTIDLKLVDMERVEVLRGPQGTLYGASALGGAVRKIPKPPALGAFSSEINLGWSTTAEKGGDNSQVTAMLNVPLLRDTLALRVAAYRFDNSGYIVNDGAADPAKVALAQQFGATLIEDDDVNNHQYTGVRASLRWQPMQRLNATLMYIDQNLDSDGHAEVNPTLRDYTIATISLRGITPNGREFFRDDHQLTNLLLEYALGPGTITSSSSWLHGDFTWTRDNSRFIPAPLAIDVPAKMSGFVEELRFSSSFDGPLQAIGGVYYEDLKNDAWLGSSWVGDPALLPPTLYGGDPSRNAVILDHNVLRVEQHAVYGEASYRLTKQLELTAGGRWFDYDRRQDNVRRGRWLTNGEFHESAAESGSRFKFNASYTVNEAALLYAQWAQGFRLGSPQQAPPSVICDLDNDGILDGTNAPVNPGDLKSDSLDSYELGGKFTLFDRRLTLNTAVFYIDWSDIPTVSPNGTCGFNVAINAAKAVSQGIELEGRWRLAGGLELRASGSYIDATFANDDPAAGARKGERLPGTAQYNALLGLQYDFEVAGNASYVRGDYGYIGKFFRTVGEQRIDLARSGDYAKLDMRFGVAPRAIERRGIRPEPDQRERLYQRAKHLPRLPARATHRGRQYQPPVLS